MSKRQEIDPSVEQALKLIGVQLRLFRVKRGLTQWEMEEAQVSYKYYQRIETGRANITIRTLVRVMRALGFEFSGFCFRDGRITKVMERPPEKGGAGGG